jgi:hypothetical protein
MASGWSMLRMFGYPDVPLQAYIKYNNKVYQNMGDDMYREVKLFERVWKKLW